MAYIENKLQEQGMLRGTNPMLAAYIKAPVLSPYQKNPEGYNLVAYDTVRYGMSNPVAIVNNLEAENRVYDINLRIGLGYRPLENLYINGIVGLYYNYNRERIFIPGYENSSIIVSDNRDAYNVVRVGVAEALNMFYNVNANYNKTFNNIHKLNVLAGGQILKTRREYDAGEGYNTTNDFYKTLDRITNKSSTLKFFGYIDLWNWMNYYLHSDYTYNNLVRGSVNVSFDAASSTGVDANRFGVFPSAALTLMAKNL
ncbi:MAG: hypothetical protein LIO65_00980 [Odoribacter sp.]|nr:hypothetical protein [Odoribacter sp.]